MAVPEDVGELILFYAEKKPICVSPLSHILLVCTLPWQFFPPAAGSDTPLPDLNMSVEDADVSANAEFELEIEPVSPNSGGGVFQVGSSAQKYLYWSTRLLFYFIMN